MNTPSHPEARILVPDLTGSHIPPSMINQQRWLTWAAPSLKKNDSSRFDKVPVNSSGLPIDAHDPKNHRTFAEVAESYLRVHKNAANAGSIPFSALQRPGVRPLLAGIAFDLPREVEPWQHSDQGPLYLVGLDWDNVVVQNKFADKFRTDLGLLGAMYVERSPSGTGMRAFALSDVPVEAFNKSGFETYSAGRFLTITGRGKGSLRRIDLDVLSNIKRSYGGQTQVVVPRAFSTSDLDVNNDLTQQSSLPPLQELLNAIPSSVEHGCSRNTWLRVIWAAKNAYGDTAETMNLLLSWSKSSEADFDQRQFDQAWGAPERHDGVKAGTLIQIARRFGWAKEPEASTVLSAPEIKQWETPTPLEPSLPLVQGFNPEMLPDQIRPWAEDVANRMQCPIDYPAISIIVAISSLIGARAVISPKAHDDWTVVPNLWGLVIGRPGVMKSPVLSAAMKPLIRLEGDEHERWYQAMEAWQLDKRVFELAEEAAYRDAKKTALKDPDAARKQLQKAKDVEIPPEPAIRRYVVNDATVEKLGEILQKTPSGLLVYRDEMHGLLTALDKLGQEGARSFYLQAYDGNQSYTFDRIGRGTQRVERVCFSLIGGIQPGRIQEYVRGAVSGGSCDDGLLQRFGLAVWPDIQTEFQYVDKWPDTPARQAVNALFDRLNRLPEATDSTGAHHFSSDAQEVFARWMEAFETEIRSPDMHASLVSHLAKYRKLVPALALIFKLIDKQGNDHIVERPELERALKWADYLQSHAERLYSSAAKPAASSAHHLLEKLRKYKPESDQDGGYFTPRKIAIKGWAGLSTVAEVTEAAEHLTLYGWLQLDIQRNENIGRPSVRYRIHPSVV